MESIEIVVEKQQKQSSSKKEGEETKTTVVTQLSPQPTSIKQYERAKPVTNEVIVQLLNIHKTYLLGIEGVPALRYR